MNFCYVYLSISESTTLSQWNWTNKALTHCGIFPKHYFIFRLVSFLRSGIRSTHRSRHHLANLHRHQCKQCVLFLFGNIKPLKRCDVVHIFMLCVYMSVGCIFIYIILCVASDGGGWWCYYFCTVFAHSHRSNWTHNSRHTFIWSNWKQHSDQSPISFPLKPHFIHIFAHRKYDYIIAIALSFFLRISWWNINKTFNTRYGRRTHTQTCTHTQIYRIRYAFLMNRSTHPHFTVALFLIGFVTSTETKQKTDLIKYNKIITANKMMAVNCIQLH